jgi:ectoine hydroxylase-related dioxygenase (phytanoyl-CoA dioxygenase family)
VTTPRDFTFDAGTDAATLRQAFNEYGIVIVRALLDKEDLSRQRTAVNNLLKIRLRTLGHPSARDDIDENLNELVKSDRRHAMDIIRAIKDSPFFYEILADRRLHEVSKACLNCETLLSVHDIAQFRIDPPNDDARNFEWHQDYQYNMMSMNSATIWYPLKRMTEDMGPLVVCPGSHRQIIPVEMDFTNHQSGSGSMHAALRFEVDQHEVQRGALALLPVEEGDVVVFHCLLLHRSSVNRSKRSRWTANPRFGDAADPAFAGRGWIGVRDKTQRVFGQYHPQFVKVSGKT